MAKVIVDLRTMMRKWELANEGRRLTQNELAAGTELSRDTISRIYSGKIDRIEIETIEKLCDFFDCEAGDIIVRVDKRKNP